MPRQLKRSIKDIKDARRTRREQAEREASGDEVPADIDEFRNRLARRISRFIGDRKQSWRDCPERICQRHRACAAPHVRCSIAPPPRPDPDGRRTARVMAQVQRTLRQVEEQRNKVEGQGRKEERPR